LGDVYKGIRCPMAVWKKYLSDELDREYLSDLIEFINLTKGDVVQFTYTEWQNVPEKLKDGLSAYNSEKAEIAEEKKIRSGE